MKKLIILCSLILYMQLILLGCATTPKFTPLPWGVKVVSPSPDLPQNIAGFSGTWYGIWDNGRSTTLVIEKIKPPEVSIIYSWGPLGKDREGGFNSYTGRIEPGKLTVKIPERGITITYMLSDDGKELKGEFRVGNSINYVTMKRQPYTISPATAQFTPLPLEVKITRQNPVFPKTSLVFLGYGMEFGTVDTQLLL